MTMHITIPVAVGELIDKITILEIKAARICDPQRAINVKGEFDVLRSVLAASGIDAEGAKELCDELKALNAAIWDDEEQLRACGSAEDFGAIFIDAARRIYHNNDRRFAVKRRLNMVFGSVIVEEKSY